MGVALDKIMKDHTAESLIEFAEVAKDTTAVPKPVQFKGLAPIRKMFDDLFEKITDDCNFETPLMEVTGDGDSKAAKQVFFVWEAKASGYKYATATFVFDDNFKITKQNIVAVMAANDKAGCGIVSMVV